MKLMGINHLAFITPDMEETIRFYRDLLGMQLTTGVGHDGFRHYFFTLGDGRTQVAFFEYAEASKLDRKFAGTPTSDSRGFDHLSFAVESKEALFALKDKLEAAGVEVHGAVDHGTLWSIYFYDPNNLSLEASWQLMDITHPPAMAETDPMAIVAEGAEPQPGRWPEPTKRTPPEKMTAHAGNGHKMREEFLADGVARLRDDARESGDFG